MWQGEVFAISDCLVVIVCAAPSHLQSVLHRSPVRWHLQLPLQATTQPQWRSSEHAWLTSARYVHWLVLVFHSQPQSLGFGILESDCFQIKAATKRARLACWNKACWVWGIWSSAFRLCVKITFIASFVQLGITVLAMHEYSPALKTSHNNYAASLVWDCSDLGLLRQRCWWP